MYPIDFGSRGAETRLIGLLQDHSPATFDPRSKGCHAECRGSLLSQVHQVLEKSSSNNSNLYLVRWKACWTPESCIDDQSWLTASLAANYDKQARRSERLRETW